MDKNEPISHHDVEKLNEALARKDVAFLFIGTPNDVMRFRRYLGQHYADERAYVTMEGGRERHHPLRLTTIYFRAVGCRAPMRRC